MLLKIFCACFTGYLRLFGGKQHQDGNGEVAFAHGRRDLGATETGNAYRGSGVLIGVLGALIVFCAIAPYGLGISKNPRAIYFGVAEVVLMIFVIATIWKVNAVDTVSGLDLKKQWIKLRLEAEMLRYHKLHESISAGDVASIAAALEPLIGIQKEHPDDQVRYNRKKHAQLHAIEHAANNATKIGFGISLGAALLHLVAHYDWLMFLTAALPAGVGALHGINSFLKLEEHAQQHQWMADRLDVLAVSFRESRMTDDAERSIELATQIYSILTSAQDDWLNVTQKMVVKAP